MKGARLNLRMENHTPLISSGKEQKVINSLFKTQVLELKRSGLIGRLLLIRLLVRGRRLLVSLLVGRGVVSGNDNDSYQSDEGFRW